MVFPESSRPEAMVWGEKELVESDKLDDNRIEHRTYKKSPYSGDLGGVVGMRQSRRAAHAATVTGQGLCASTP